MNKLGEELQRIIDERNNLKNKLNELATQEGFEYPGSLVDFILEIINSK